MKKTLRLLTVCLILSLSFSACGDKDEAEETGSAAVIENETDSSGDNPELFTEDKPEDESEAGLPGENEAADKPTDEAEAEAPKEDPKDASDKAPEETPGPVSETAPDETAAVTKVLTLLMDRSTSLNFGAAMELTAPGSGAHDYLSRRAGSDPESMLGEDIYAQIKALANFVDVDITTQTNSEKLVTFIRRLAPYLSYSVDTVTVDEAVAHAEVSVIMPEVKISTTLNAINEYLVSLGTDFPSARETAAQMSADEKAAYTESLVWGFAEYALGGGVDLSQTEIIPLEVTLSRLGGRWLVTDIKELESQTDTLNY